MSDEPDSLPTLNSLECWDYSVELQCLDGIPDLQLAAELGKTLLERNKELETSLRQHQICVEDQAQEIYHLSKQTVTLREVNETRVRFYEQLEVSIHDLERANHKLVLDNLAQKKHIKSLNATIESLEGKCEELQATVDEQKLRLNELERISQQHVATPTTTETTKSVVKDFVTPKPLERRDDSKGTDSLDSSRRTDEEKCTPPKNAPPAPQSVATTEQPKSIDNGAQNKESFYDTDCDMEQVNQLVAELRIARAQCNRDERRITELEEQLSSLVQQNQELENQLVQLAHREEDSNMKSMHEELTTLEEVRQGQMCCRCLRSLDYSNSEIIDDDSMLDEILEISGPEQVHRSSFNMEIQDNHLEELLRREMSVSVMWISPAANIFSIFVDLCLYVKDCYLVPFFARPLKIPFILLHYCLKHKLH